MRYDSILLFIGCLVLILAAVLSWGCTGKQEKGTETLAPMPLTTINQIDSFNVDVTCGQALEVISNNPYDQEFFERVFARIVEQCQNSKSPANADVIWERFVSPLSESGKVPPDLAKTTWNYYFSRNFISLPTDAPVGHYCLELAGVKKNLEKEYKLKKLGFEICEQGSPDAHFLNAMYVYNTMWAACNDTQ